MSQLEKTPYGFEYDPWDRISYQKAWDLDEEAWKKADPEGFAASKREEANAKRRATRERKKREKELASNE